MRGAVVRTPAPVGARPLSIEDAADPQPGPGEVLLRVRACGVCRTDLHVVEGELPQRRPAVIPGHQAVGEIVAFGPPAPPPPARSSAAQATPGSGPPSLAVGQRVGAAWLRQTCGVCRFCTRGRENLCEQPRFSGWTDDGGFAELMIAPSAFLYPLPDGFSDRAAAPLLCAGIIGYRALRLTGITDWAGARLGLYGFGAAGHVAIQLARGRGAEVYVCTRDRTRHQALAAELGAAWVGDAAERPPVALDAAIIFAPAGSLVPPALEAIDRGGSVVRGATHMTPLPALPYARLWGGRALRWVPNNPRDAAHSSRAGAAPLPVRTHTEVFPLAEANR